MYKREIAVNWIKAVTLLSMSTLHYLADGPKGENTEAERVSVSADMRRAEYQEQNKEHETCTTKWGMRNTENTISETAKATQGGMVESGWQA